MKFDAQESTAELTGDIKTNQVDINTEDLSHVIFSMITKLYSNPISSFIREIVSNAYDSHIEAGISEPVIISIKKSVANYDKISIAISDSGVGLSEERFNGVFKKLGASTKRDSNAQLGKWGYGKFSGLAVADTVEITTVHGGYKYMYIMYIDGLATKIDLVSKKESDEKTGLTMRLEIPSHKFSAVESAIINQLKFFEDVYIDDSFRGIINLSNYPIQKYKNFAVTVVDKHQSHVVNGKVVYPVDYAEVKKKAQDEDTKELLTWMMNAPKDIYPLFEIGDLSITPSREALLYDELTCDNIINKVKAIHAEMNDMYLKMFQGITFTKIKDFVDLNIDLNSVKIPFGDKQVIVGFNPDKNSLVNFNGHNYSLVEVLRMVDVITTTKIVPISHRVNNSTLSVMKSDSTSISLKDMLNNNAIMADMSNMKLVTKAYIRKNHSTQWGTKWSGTPIVSRTITAAEISKAFDKRINSGTPNNIYQTLFKDIVEHITTTIASIPVVDDSTPSEAFITANKPVYVKGAKKRIKCQFSRTTESLAVDELDDEMEERGMKYLYIRELVKGAPVEVYMHRIYEELIPGLVCVAVAPSNVHHLSKFRRVTLDDLKTKFLPGIITKYSDNYIINKHSGHRFKELLQLKSFINYSPDQLKLISEINKRKHVATSDIAKAIVALGGKIPANPVSSDTNMQLLHTLFTTADTLNALYEYGDRTLNKEATVAYLKSKNFINDKNELVNETNQS